MRGKELIPENERVREGKELIPENQRVLKEGEGEEQEVVIFT